MGKVSLSEAFESSLNTIAVQLLDNIGFEKVIHIANKLGVGKNRKLGTYYPLAIGAYEQTVLEMTAAYAAVTNRGKYIKPTLVEEIRGPDNSLIWDSKTQKNKRIQAIGTDVADTLNLMLQRSVSIGTGKEAKLKERPVAGKTGTSEGGRDLWFIGSIPQLTTGIWFGHDNNRKTKSTSGEAAWAWKVYMTQIANEFPIIPFPSRPIN